MNPVKFLPAAVAAMLLGGCAAYENEPEAAYAASGERQCFFLSQVNGYNYVGNDQVRVSTGPGEDYLFETFGPCPDLAFAESLAFDQNGPGQICNGIDVDLIVPGAIGPQRCAVRMIRKLPD
ncbi:hypothetical protein GCM10011371_19060 [Novosphingobium marinum]|uniref:Lipoprotein n=1 Tax=Novosphingobium marinum TaxID=1514948 RepID=A0A7Z0BV92_9SPHN|nr:DUF6491 family protein [Novosphingobium marinum]NYH96018.1 hypothetical protein [Novosphingobium marinum]GGC31800.1 hypothetical protein GCM10011371_19060 [Novosphingobium marinum]